MVDSLLLLFMVTSLVLIVTRGQDIRLVMSRSIAQGCNAGVITAAGVNTGLLGHSLVAASTADGIVLDQPVQWCGPGGIGHPTGPGTPDN